MNISQATAADVPSILSYLFKEISQHFAPKSEMFVMCLGGSIKTLYEIMNVYILISSVCSHLSQALLLYVKCNACKKYNLDFLPGLSGNVF